jgi:hypothetical protein
MTDSRAVSGLDRLPWLTDEPSPPKPPRAEAKRSGRDLVGWLIAATVLVAGVSYWFGMRTATDQLQRAPAARTAEPTATVKLPQARETAQPEVAIPPAPEVRPAPAPVVRIIERIVERPVPVEQAPTAEGTNESASANDTAAETAPVSRPVAAAPKPQAAATSQPRRVAAAPSRPWTLWPSRVTQGASGRLVQIGAFGSRLQAKQGWWYMVRAYPGVKRLPAVVVETRNSRGRPFYRFQIGTTSQAHSEVLCQRMETIHYSCAVVGLPWKSKVER